jgi:hypothetical protein
MTEIKSTLSLIGSVIASEHFFSTFLSSPLTVETLYKQQKEDVYKYLVLASVISIGWGLLLDNLLKDTNHLGLYGSSAVCLIYFLTYYNALK